MRLDDRDGGRQDEQVVDGPEPAAEAGWQSLLDFVQANRSVDLRGYKPVGLARRVRKRMRAIGIGDFAAYQDYLQVHPDEFTQLFDTIHINVTSYFRDPEAWEMLRTEAIPALADQRGAGPIRIWSAGCATGEEAYTTAIMFAEALGQERFRERVKIYATDIDEGALGVARQAVYAERQLQNVPPALVGRYFDRTDAGFAFRKDLRRQVIFGLHDVMQDPPISRIDLLVCRNMLMYFSAEMQARILMRFHFALNEGGLLFLGRAETLMSYAEAFSPLDLRVRIFRKGPGIPVPDRGPPTRAAVDEVRRAGDPTVHRAALQALPTAYIVLDRDGLISAISERARVLFGLDSSDLQRPLRDLRLSYQPLELRALVDQAARERRTVLVRDIEWPQAPGDSRWFDVQVIALTDMDGSLLGTGITFTDVTNHKRLQRDLEHAGHRLERSNEDLQSTNEELETTNEELQSTIEELETTNEELQSTNEELETMNEELQSTSDEVHTVNEELHLRGMELNATNAFLNSVINSLSSAVVVLDRELRVMGWNGPAEDLWGLRRDEVRGQHFMNLDIGLPVQELRRVIRQCAGGDERRTETLLKAITRRGRAIQCRIVCSPLDDEDGTLRGTILIMDDAGGPAEGAGTSH